MRKRVLALLTTVSLTGCVGVLQPLSDGWDALEKGARRSGSSGTQKIKLEDFYAGIDHPDQLDVSTTHLTAHIIANQEEIGTNEIERGDCYVSEPATSRGVIVDAGETSISAVCQYFSSDRFRWAYSRFDFIAKSGRVYRVAVLFDENAVLGGVENNGETISSECMALIDTSTGSQLSCNAMHELPDFSRRGNIATNELTAEVSGDLPLCGVTSPYVANRQGRGPPLRNRIIVGPGRLRIYAACLRHGLLDIDYYRAVFELDVIPGTIYKVRRIDNEADLGTANSDNCIRPITAEEPVPIALCISDGLPKPTG